MPSEEMQFLAHLFVFSAPEVTAYNSRLHEHPMASCSVEEQFTPRTNKDAATLHW